jgi:glycosyltransferase involved in cell wall biosynthesis
MKISVVVPVYNAEKYLKGCIEALLSQDYPREKSELIFVDDCSNDSSAEIIKGYPVTYLRSDANRGAYASRNKGIEHATGEIVAFTDPDCIPVTNWLKNIAAAMGPPEVMVVMGYQQSGRKTNTLALLDDYETMQKEYIFNSDIRALYYGYTNNMAVRRELFDTLGGFLERRRGSDTIFVSTVVNKYTCSAVAYRPEIRIRHLEIDNLLKYCRKKFIYGRSRRSYRHLVVKRTLNIRESIAVYKRTKQRGGLSLLQSIFLFILLNLCVIPWQLGLWTPTLGIKSKG